MPADLIRTELTSSLSSATRFYKSHHNTIQAMPKGGTLAIPAAPLTERDALPREMPASVRADINDKLFSPLFTNKTKGTGLSLAVCKRVVELHDDAIVVERDEGRGAQFVLRLLV
jgi:hypothetical protein